MPFNNQITGSVIASVLDYAHLIKITNDPEVIDPKKSGWIPADGRSIAGSQLSTLSGMQNAPDLRGRFLRGLNTIYNVGQPPLNSSTADVDDPASNRKAGDYQGDVFTQHTHACSHFNGGVITDMSNDQDQRRCSYGNMIPATTDPASVGGGSETRPKNIAVYYYIKIN